MQFLSHYKTPHLLNSEKYSKMSSEQNHEGECSNEGPCEKKNK